jgi:WD40 repeat protein
LSPEYVRGGAWSPDGKHLAVVGGDSVGHVLDAINRRPVRKLEGPPLADGATSFAWSADGKRLAVGGLASLNVWSAETGKQLWRKDERAVTVAWSPDGRWLAATDNTVGKGAVRIWEAETGKLLHESPMIAEEGVAWSPDGKHLAALPVVGEESLIIDAGTGAVHLKLKTGGGHGWARWSSDGKTLTTLDKQGQLREWDAATGEVRRRVQFPGVRETIGAAAWSPDGKVLACAGRGTIHLYDAGGRPLGVLLPFDLFGQLAVTADGRHRGNARVERQIRMIVQKPDGTSEMLTPTEFEQKYNFKNDPAKVRLTD